MSTDTHAQPEGWTAERASFEAYMDETHFAYWRTTAFGREAWRMWKAAVLAASPQPTAAQPLTEERSS